ncbi:MAB_1171c family putative transporter [Gordonia sp. CPCC 205515]|uniref:MAB_1171c family putative transporter n=1 Tax=Gordonia sp. CPCC 205515 TaxID=3140791 RepID=UPI003AF3F883
MDSSDSSVATRDGCSVIVVGVLNALAAVVFAGALCWRLEQIRRQGGGLQPIAMTVAIAALTLAFVVSNDDVADALNTALFVGAERVVYCALLALGVAALIVVFFFPDHSTREHRAGVEAIPLVAAIIGLQVTMLVIPTDMRTETISEPTVQNIAFALFVLIASGYLTYGFLACVHSVRRFLRVADGYLRISLGLLVLGLAALALSSLLQIAFVIGASTGLFGWDWLLTCNTVCAILGVVAFLIGISYPMLHARWQSMTAGRRHRREAEELLPLWTLITDAIPEVVLPAGSSMSSSMLLRRRVIEIRDGLTQLSPYLTEDFEVVDDAARAEMLWAAADEYVAVGRARGAVRDVLPADAVDLDQDAAPLIRLSHALAEVQASV